MTAVRTFPLRSPPVAGEALDSWLEALAHRMQACYGDVLAAVGLSGRDHRTPDGRVGWARDWTVLLEPDAVARIAVATGASPSAIAAMTLSRYSGTALVPDPARRRPGRALWGWRSGSRYCPTCLAESAGRWQLSWRLGWSFACPTHHRLLADGCPICGRVARLRPYPSYLVPRPGRCAASAGITGLSAHRCGFTLTNAETLTLTPEHPAMAAQALLLDVITTGRAAFGVYAADPQPARSALSDVRALARRILTYAPADDLATILPADLLTAYERTRATTPGPAHARRRPGLIAPAHAATTAVGVAAALTILRAPDIRRAGDALRWLIAGSRRRGLPVGATTVTQWGRGSTAVLAAAQLAALDPLLKPSGRLRYRTATTRPRIPASGSATADRLTRATPTLLWPAWSLRLAIPHCHQLELRPAVSGAILLVGTRLRLSEAAGQLGGATNRHRISRVLQLMEADPHWPGILTALTRVADHLATHGAPIDYQRRRALDYTTLLPVGTWSRLCRRVGALPGTRKSAIARCVLFEQLSGLPAARAPFAVDTGDFRAHVATFPKRLTPALATGLHDAARAFLREQGIDEELVSWHPPLTLLADLRLPGPDPADVDIATLHRLVRAPRVSLEAAAAQLNTTLDTVRYVLATHPVRADPAADGQVFVRARAALPRADFVHLYVDRQMTLREIGRRIGVSRQTISRLAGEYGIHLRKAPLPRTVIERDWLYRQYVIRRRTLPDLARETGMSTANMSRWAHAHAIPLRGRGGASHNQTLRAADRAYAAPTILRPALTGVGGWERLHRFRAAAEFPTIGAAATALGTHQGSLTIQIHRLEHDLGGKLIIRAERGRPMALTPLGLRVRRAILRAADGPDATTVPRLLHQPAPTSYDPSASSASRRQKSTNATHRPPER